MADAHAHSTLRANALNKRYGAKTAVESVSIAISRGEIVGLLGPNGAGKTTCFYMVVGLVRPDAGTIFLDNEELTHAPVHKRAAAAANSSIHTAERASHPWGLVTCIN